MRLTTLRHASLPPAHPADVLAEVIGAMDLTKTEIAQRLGVTRKALYDLLDRKSAISPSMAVRLADVVGSSAEVWLGLQAQHDLWMARKVARQPKSDAGRPAPIDADEKEIAVLDHRLVKNVLGAPNPLQALHDALSKPGLLSKLPIDNLGSTDKIGSRENWVLTNRIAIETLFGIIRPRTTRQRSEISPPERTGAGGRFVPDKTPKRLKS